VVSSPILNQRRADRERSSIEEVLVIEDEEQLQPTVKAEETTRKLKSKEDHPQSVPGFRLLQKLGEGGMGEVFEAEQLEPVRRKVALKLIKRGMESKEVLARFDAERQALALMSHPNIAQVYDAGTTEDGRPYFVMEFIQGVPVTQYCDTNRLTTEERLELFTQICDGVQHAHHKGVIHRDIKPSNVLVKIQDSKPVPKIIDFGVAKAVAQRLTEQSVFTAIGEFIGTPEYMSPEQAEMTELDVDTRTDVYSLGVVLYELLVGAPPFDARELRQAGFSEMRRRIREDEPPRPSLRLSGLGEASTTAAEKRRSEPSTLARQLHGDLDWITMKALEKDRTRRYDSPGELAADISRHLRDEPVLAGPPSATYRVKKFVRRHTLGVAAGAFMVLALIVGVAGIALGLVRAREAERQASQEAETATQISDFLIGLFEVSDPSEAKGETITAREILDEGAEKIRSELADQPLVQARLMMTMGNVYQSLALYKSAAPLLEEALEINERHLEPDDPRIASNLNNLALLYKEQGMYAEAEPLYQRALPIWEEALGPDHPDLASSLDNLANLYSDKGKYEEAVLLSERALAIREKSFGPDHPETAVSLNNLTILYRVLGRLADAEPLALRALEIREKALGPDHPELASSLANLAKLRAEQGKYAEAVPYYQRALAIMEKALGPGHPDLAVSLNDLANLYLAQAKYTEAEPLLRRRITPPSGRTLTTSQTSSVRREGTQRPNPSTGGDWRSPKKPSDRIIPTSGSASTTSPPPVPIKGSMRKPSLSTAGRWRSSRMHSGRITASFRKVSRASRFSMQCRKNSPRPNPCSSGRWKSMKKSSDRITPGSPPASAISPMSTPTSGSTLRPNRYSGGRWRSRKRPLGPITPAWLTGSTTSGSFTSSMKNTPRPSLCS
jgi:non-specific serine/threonine protein kinase/serine/threonine-protein kinase